MEIGCDLATIRDEDLLKKMWQQSEDFSRKREIRTHLCKLRESRLKEFYSTGFGSEIMNPATDVPYGKSPLTPSHGDSLADQSFQSLKAKEVRDSESSVRDIKFRNSGGVAGGVLVPDTSGWNVQTMSEVSPDGRAFRSETLATTEGVEKLQGGVAEFAGRNEQNSSTSHQGDDQNYVKKAAESSKTQLQEKVVIGDENSGRTEMKSSSTMSSSSKVISSSTTKVISGDDPAIEATPRHLPQDQQYEKITSASNTNRSRNEQHHIQRTETNDTKEVSNNHSEENKRYANMDKSSPEYQQHVQYLMSQPGTVVSNTVEYPKPGVKMITTVKKLPDGTTVKTKRYETEPSADNSSISQTPRHHQQQQQHHQQKTTTNSTHKLTEKTVDDAEDVFSRLSRPRDQAGPASPLKTPETSSVEDTQIRLQKTRGEKRFSDTIDQRSTQILRDSTQRSDTPVPSNVTPRRVHDIVDNVETTARSTETVKNIRNQKIISDDFIQKERDRLVPNKDSPVRGEPNDTSVGTRPSQPVGGRPNQVPSNELSSTNVIQQSSKSSEKYSESRRYSTETVESYQHSETHKESQDYTTHGFPSTRRPSDIPRGRSPSVGQPRQDFSTHGFPSVRSDKPTQEYPSEKPKNFDERHQPGNSRQPYSHDTSTTTSRVNETHQHVTTEEFGTQSYPRQSDFPLRPTGQEPSRKPAQGTDRGYPSVRPDAPRDQSPRRPSSGEPSYARPSDNYTTHGYPSVRTDAPRYPPGMEPSEKQYRPDSQGSPTQGQKHGQPTGRKSDDFSTHGFPSVKPGRTTPTPSVDREDTISVASDRSTSVLYEKKIDAAHQAFARSLRCASPVDNIRRDSYSDRQSPRTSISSTRNTYSPSKYDGRSPSRESITNSEFSRVSSGTVTKTQKNTATDGRRPSGPKSPIRKSRPSNISNETIDLSLTRRIRPKPQDSTVKPAGKPSDKPVDKKPTERSPYKSSVTPSDRPSGRSADRPSERPSKRPSESPSERPSGRPSDRPSDRTFGRPSVRPSDKPSERLSGRPSQRPSDRSPQKPTEDNSISVEPVLHKKTFSSSEGFLEGDGITEEPILTKSNYYVFGLTDNTLPSNYVNKSHHLGTSSTTPRRTTKTLIEDEIDHLIDTSTTLTTPASHSIPTPKKSPKPKETTKPKTPKTIYSSKPKKPTRGYISLNRANQISNRHNETTNKHVSYPHYLSSGPKADRSSPYPEFRQSPSPDRTSIKSRSPARYSNSTSPEPYNAPKTIIDKSKRAPSPSPTRQTSPSPSRVTNVTTTKHTKTIRTDDSITHDINQTKQDRSHKPDDMDEGCVPDISRPQKLKPQEPTSDDEGFEPESPRASSPTSDFEYRGATQTFDEEDSRITKIYKNDRKTVTDDFLRTERKTDHPRGPAENTHKPSQSPTEPKRTNQFPRPNQQSSPKSDSKTPRRPSKDDQKPGEYEPRGPKRSSLTMASEKTNQIDRKQSYTVEEREYSTNRPTNEAKQPTKSIKREPSDGLITYEDKEPKHLAKTPLGRREPSDELKSTHHLKSITKEHAPREPFNKTPGDKRQASPQRSVRQPNESSPKTLPSTIHPADNSQKPRRPKGNEPLDTNHKTPTSQDSPRAFGEPLTSRGPRPQLNRSETYEDRCRQILGIERETIIDQTNEVQDFINIERSSVFTKRPKDESPVGHEADITEKTATTTTKTTKVDHDVSQEEPQDRLTRKPSDKTGRLVDIKKSQADENIERTSRTSTNINIHERKPTAKQPFKSTPSSEYPEDDLLRPKPSAPSLSDEDDQPSKRPDQSPSRKPKGRTPLGFDHIEDQHIRKTTKTTTDSVAELVDSQTKPRLRPEPKDESPEDEQHPDTPSSHRETPLEEEDISYPRRSTTKKTDITVKTSRKDNRTTVETIDIEDSEDYPQERRPRDHLPETEYVSPRRGAPITDYPEHKPSPRTSPTRKPGSESYPRHTEFNAPGERIPKTSFPDNKHPQSTSPFRKPVPESRPGQKSPQSTSPSRIPTSESRPRDYSPEGKPTKKSTPDHRSPQSTSPTRKPTPETRSRDYSPEEKPSKKFSPDHRSPQSTSPTRKPTSESRPRDYSPEEKTNKRSTPDHRSPQRASPTRKPEHKSPQRISPSRKSVPTRGPRDHSPKERIPKAPEDDYSPETDHYSLGERSPKSKRPYGLSPTRKPVYPDESEERHTTNVTILRTDRYPKTNGRSPSPSAKRRLPTDEETGEVTINEKTTAVSKRTTVTRTDTEDYPHKDRPRERSPQKPTSRDESPTGKTHKPRPEDYTIHTTTKTTKLEGITAPRSVSPSKIVAFPNKPRDRSPEIPKTQSTTVTVVHRSIKPGDERVPRTSSPTTEKPRQRSPIGKTTVFQKKINATTNKKDESTIEIVDIQDYPNRRPSPDRPSPTYRTTIPGRNSRETSPSDRRKPDSYPDHTTSTDQPRDSKYATVSIVTKAVITSPDYEVETSPRGSPRQPSPSGRPGREFPTNEETITHRTTKTSSDRKSTTELKLTDHPSPNYPRGSSPTKKTSPRDRSPIEKPWREGPQSYKTSPRDDSPQKPKAPKSTTSTVVQKTIRKGVEHPNENHTRRAPFREPEELTDEDIEESVETVQHSTTRKTVTDRRTVEQIEHDHHRVEEHPQRKPASETPHRTSPTGANQEPRKTRPMSPSKPQAFDTEPRGRKPKGTSTTTRTTPVKVPISSPKSSKQSPTRQHSISPDSSPSRPVSEAESLSPTRSPDTSPIRKTSPKATHITTANFQMSPPATRKKASEPTKPQTSSTNSIQTTTKITTTRSEKPIPNKRDDIPETDGPQSEKSTPKRNPVIERKESAPVPRVTQINKSHQKMSRSTSENTIKTSSPKRPPIHDDNSTSPVNNKGSPKPERRPVKHLTTKTINLSSLDNVIHSEDMENIEIDIQQAKSSREPSPNKIVPIPVPVDLYTGDPRYPDTVQEPEDEPRRKPVVKNIPIYEEESRDFIHCQITEIESTTDTLKNRTKKFIDGEAIPQRADRTTIIGDNVDNECLLSVHDKVSKFISTAEEVCKPKSSAPFRRHVSKEHVPEDDECLLSVDEKVNKFLKTAESVTNEVVTSTTKPLDRPNVHDIDEDLKTDECFLTVSQKVNKFTTKAEKLAPTTPQRSPELVSRIERQISKKGEPESPNDSESPTENGSPTTTRKIHHTRSLFERADKKYTDRQIDILSRPSVWSKKSPADVKLEDILDSDGPKQESQPRDDTEEPEPMNTIHPVKDNSEERHSRPVFKPTTDTVSKRKEVFEKKISNQKTTFVPKPHSTSPQSGRNDPHRTHSPTDGSKKRTPLPDQRIPNRLTPQDVQDHSSPVDGIHEDFYGSTEFHETTATGTTFKRQSPERSPTREPKSPRSSRVSESPRQPTKSQPSSRYPNNNSPQHPSGDQSHYHPRQQSHSPIRKSPDPSRTRRDHSPVDRSRQSVETEEYAFTSTQEQINSHYTTHQTHVGTRDSPLTPTSLLDDDDREYSPPRSGATGPSQRRPTTHKTPVSRTIDTSTPRQPRRPSASGSEPSTPRNPKAHTARSTPENVSARRNIFETHSGDVSPKPDARRPSYMEHTKSSLEHRKDSIEVTKSNYSRKSSIDDEYHEISPRTTIKFNTGLRHREEPKLKRKPSSSDLANIEDIYDLEFLEEMLNIVTVYEQRRRIRAQIRVVKKLLETKTKDEVARMTKITSLRKASVSSARDSPVPRRESTTRSDKYHPSDDIDSESVIESQHVEEHEEVIHEKKSSPRTKTSRTVTKVTEIRKAGEHSSPKRPSTKKDEPRDSKPIWATKNILKKPSENEKVTRALSSKRTTSTTSSSTVRTQQAHRQRPSPDEDCITSSYGIGPTDEDGRPLFGIRALKKKSTTTKGAQPSETMKVTGTVVTEKYYSENGAEPVGEREVTMYSTNPEDLEEIEYIHDRRDSDTIKQEVSSKDGLTTVTKVQRIGKFKPEEHPALTDDPDAMKTSSKTVRRGSVKEMSEKFIRKESSSSVTEKSSGYPKAGLIYRTQSNSGATADAADQYEIRSRSVEHDEESDNECSVEMRSTRRHSKQTTENENETEIRRTINTKSFLNSAGSRVTGMDDVLERMRNADNVVVDGDTEDDREARALLNKFIGASVIMSGVESIVPQKELKRTIIRPDGVKEVKTTRVTKTIKSTGTGGNSSTPVARETCAFEEIWDEEYLKDLLEKSTNYEERRLIRARIRQLMAEREARGGLKSEANNEKPITPANVKPKSIEDQEDDSSASEYEEIIEEYTASEDEEEDDIAEAVQQVQIKEEAQKPKTTTTTQVPKNAPNTTTVEKTTPAKNDDRSSSDNSESKNSDTKEHLNANTLQDNSKGESLLIPLLQGILHKNMPQARPFSSVPKTTTNTTATVTDQNSNHLRSNIRNSKSNLSSTRSNINNSGCDSGVSSEVSKPSSLSQGSTSLRVAPQQIEDSGTESGEDLRLIAAGLRNSMQIEGIEDQSDMSIINEVTNALNRLEISLKEGKDLALDNNKRSALLALVERLQTGLTAPEKLSYIAGDINDTSSPDIEGNRLNRQRFAKRRNRNNRHTVGVSKEELADARRYMEELVLMDNLSNCTTPESNAAPTPPQFTVPQNSDSIADTTPNTSNLARPNQFVSNNIKQSAIPGSLHPDVQLRQKKINSTSGQRQSIGETNSLSTSESLILKRPLSDSYESYSTPNNRVTFIDATENNARKPTENNYYHKEMQPDLINRMSPDSLRMNRFNTKKQLMKRANTIDIPKSHRYNPEFDTDSDLEDRNSSNTKGLRGTVQVSVKRKPRQVIPTFEPKTENDHKFLAFIQKQNATPGLAWGNSKSVSNWTNKFGNIKNIFESGVNNTNMQRQKEQTHAAASAKNFWKKAEEQNISNPPKVSSAVLTSALKAKERNENISQVMAPKPVLINKFSHNPQSAFRPIDTASDGSHMQFQPIEKSLNVNAFSPTKSFNPISPRKHVLNSPNYSLASPTKSWIKKNTATNSPVTLPWTVKAPEIQTLKTTAAKFDTKSPVQRHQSFKQQQQQSQKRPSLPNTFQPYTYDYVEYPKTNFASSSHLASYADYTPPRLLRECSLTNPSAEPIVLTPDKPAYSPHSLQTYDYYTDVLHPTANMTDDDIDELESMTEYRVEAKVMQKPISQQAITVGKRTAHVGDDQELEKNSRAAKNLLTIMKNIGNGNSKEDPSKKDNRIAMPNKSITPEGRSYQAPIVEPLFPDVTSFEPNRMPEYTGIRPQRTNPVVQYQQNPAYVPLQNCKPSAAVLPSYLPQERPNFNHKTRPEVPNSLSFHSSSTSSQAYSSPSKTPESTSYKAPAIVNYEQQMRDTKLNGDYSMSKKAIVSNKDYDESPLIVKLPQIPLETSYTRVYDKPRNIKVTRPPPPNDFQAVPQRIDKVPQTYPPHITPKVEAKSVAYLPPTYQPQSPDFIPQKTDNHLKYYQARNAQEVLPTALPPRSPEQSLQSPTSPIIQPLMPRDLSHSQSSARYQEVLSSPKVVPPKVPQSASQQLKNYSEVHSSRSHQSRAAYSEKYIEKSPTIAPKQTSLDSNIRAPLIRQEKIVETRRKSLGNTIESAKHELEQKAAAIRKDMYTVQQEAYAEQYKNERTQVIQQETKVYKSSAPDDTPDIVKSSLKKEDIPILKKFGPPQRHCYLPNAYQQPTIKTDSPTKQSKPLTRKFSDSSSKRGPVIVTTPSTPQPDSQDQIPRNIVFNNISAFTSMSRKYSEDYNSGSGKLTKCDSWHQICQAQNESQPTPPKFGSPENSLRRSKSGHVLALPRLYEAGYDKADITEKQKTVAAYFSGQKSPTSLSRTSSKNNVAEEVSTVTVKKTSINRVKSSQKASISKQSPSSGLSRSHTMPHITNVTLLDESNVEDAFEQLMNGSSTTTEKTETKKENGGIVTTTTKVTTRTVTGGTKPVSPFTKFQQLDKQNSLQSPKSPLTPSNPGGSSSTPIFRFTDPALNARAATVKEQLLQWCQSKTQEYENVQITNFSTSWTDGLAFCALIHHFLPDAFDYSKLNPKQRRHNFELAFRVADEKAGIAPLLDVEDMVVMKRPDWKCVFTYVQTIYRRFRNCQ